MPDRRGRRPRRLARAGALHFALTCVSANGDDIHAMTEAAHPITRGTFVRYVASASLRSVERDLGYHTGPGGNGLHMARDWSVNYFRSTYRGRPCVYFCWSGIEHIFT